MEPLPIRKTLAGPLHSPDEPPDFLQLPEPIKQSASEMKINFTDHDTLRKMSTKAPSVF